MQRQYRIRAGLIVDALRADTQQHIDALRAEIQELSKAVIAQRSQQQAG